MSCGHRPVWRSCVCVATGTVASACVWPRVRWHQRACGHGRGGISQARAAACGLRGLHAETDSSHCVLLMVPDVFLFRPDQEEPDLVSALCGLRVSMEGSPCLVPPRPDSARAGWAARCWPGSGGVHGAVSWFADPQMAGEGWPRVERPGDGGPWSPRGQRSVRLCFLPREGGLCAP